jgi:RNA polymerase sigma factor (sigma-70 family)
MMKEIEWGANISDLADMVLMEVVGDGKKVYTREGQKMKIGDADIERVMYGFHEERLYELQILFRSFFNFVKLKEVLFKLYGPGLQPSRFLETYHWYGKETSVFLTYDEKSGKGAIGYTFLPIYKERQEDKKLQEVSSWLALLTDKERKVITLRFGFNGEDPLNVESIGERLGLAAKKVHQIGAKAIEKLRKISKKKDKNLVA